jgi:hypothetical protein
MKASVVRQRRGLPRCSRTGIAAKGKAAGIAKSPSLAREIECPIAAVRVWRLRVASGSSRLMLVLMGSFVWVCHRVTAKFLVLRDL